MTFLTLLPPEIPSLKCYTNFPCRPICYFASHYFLSPSPPPPHHLPLCHPLPWQGCGCHGNCWIILHLQQPSCDASSPAQHRPGAFAFSVSILSPAGAWAGSGSLIADRADRQPLGWVTYPLRWSTAWATSNSSRTTRGWDAGCCWRRRWASFLLLLVSNPLAHAPPHDSPMTEPPMTTLMLHAAYVTVLRSWSAALLSHETASLRMHGTCFWIAWSMQ